jgi:glucose/arabinose dehydrogenase
MGEVFLQSTLISGPLTSPAANRLYDPWEITYGPDDSLWVTEAKGYKVKKVNPVDGGQRTILDLTPSSSFTPANFKCKFTPASLSAISYPWPQGGMMGLAIHPDFNNVSTPKKYVYIAYVDSSVAAATVPPSAVTTNYAGELVKGWVFVTYLVRFTYNGANLVNPVMICDTLRGSNDHNSGRILIKKIGGVPYLVYALGDMGAGQFDNIQRVEKAQMTNSYEGKILRFNLEPDGDAGTYDQWIPNDNPFNASLGVQSAVWSMGIRNNQGFAYDSVNDIIYGASHGPFSDDELNIIEANRNYGHPLVIGDSTDGNYNNAKAGPSTSSLPLISTERASVTTINTNGLPTGTTYKNPLYSFYPAPAGNTSTLWSVQYIYTNQNYTSAQGPAPNGQAQNVNIWWKSEAVSGLDLYSSSLIPGWKNSLLSACLKGGRIMRTRLNTAGTAIVPTAGGDTITYFRSVNRFRDMAISPDGKNIFAVIDSSSVTSGPTTASPMVSACPGCLQRYTFLGYNDNAGASTISNTIPIGVGASNTLSNGTTITIDGTNNNLWVPITDSLGNILAEIDANGNSLGTVTTTFFQNTGVVRKTNGGTPYLDRSLTITPQTQPATAVNVRLYLTAAELTALMGAPGTTVTGIGNVTVYKNTDASSSTLTALPISVTPSAIISKNFGANYVLTVSISSFSSFYFSGPTFVLPVELLALSGKYADGAVALDWKTNNENNSANFIVEKSTTGQTFKSIGTVAASGFTSSSTNYAFKDNDLAGDYAPVLYYRLKMFDQNGAYKYSNTISVNLPALTGAVTVSPNPVPADEMKAFVDAPANTKTEWRVIDNAGRTLLTGNATVKKGNNQLLINVAKLPAGTYYLHVTGNSIECKTKFQKL